MVKLANIFDEGATSGPTGANMEATVRVPRGAVGKADGVWVDIPLVIDGLRRADPHGDGEKIRLHLPEGLDTRQRTALRLRGQGAAPTDSRSAGDLYVHIDWTDDEKARWLPWFVALGLGAAATAAALLLI